MSQCDPRSVLRIAIAFAALKHKPRDQSTAAYLLDLQSRFPVASKEDGQEWRTYALELEKQLATLKAQRDADQELLSKLRADASQVASTSDAPPPKKKSKKNPTKDQHEPEWNWDQSRADWSRVLSSKYPTSPSLIAAYTALKGVLASPDVDLLSYASRLTDATLRVLDTIHVFLFSPPDPQTQSATDASLRLVPEFITSTRIAVASPLLMYVLRTALPALVRVVQDGTKSKRQRQRVHAPVLTIDAQACVGRVLDRLLECVLLPFLRAIVPLCSARLAPLLAVPLKGDRVKVKKGKGKVKDKDKGARSTESAPVDSPPKHTDVRTDVFALIGTSLDALDALPPIVSTPSQGGSGARVSGGSGIASGIRDRLGLETIRELETLYAVPYPGSQQPQGTASEATPVPAPTPSLPTPIPTPTPTPLSAPPRTEPRTEIHGSSEPQPQSQQRTQTQKRRTTPESRAKRLERLAGTRSDRVRVLATRDAGWFLTSTLSLCVAPTAHVGTTGQGSGTLLRHALLDRIGKLVRSVPLDGYWRSHLSPASEQSNDTEHAVGNHATSTIDPVCQNMLLAICERAMGQLASP